ncbi:MAG: hypothetical protein JXR70_00155 [Spirochaetales bacterium]|nr:hypothetical protein [Spirochaetales bacterium]
MKKARCVIICFIAIFLLLSCEPADYENLPQEELYHLALGRMENQIDLFQFDKTSAYLKTSYYFKNGMYFISNGPALKVMQFNSYGDLMFLLYNPDVNPLPTSPSAENLEGQIADQKSRSYFFKGNGKIVVASDNSLFIEDQIPKEQIKMDEKLNVKLISRVLRFDRSGILKDYIGQEGIGGSPFPYISDLFINHQDNLVVTSMVPGKKILYWYKNDGNLLYNLSFDNSDLPKEGDLIPSLEKILVSYHEDILYLHIIFYEEVMNLQTQTRDTFDVSTSRLYKFNVRENRFVSFIELPKSDKLKIQNNNKTNLIPGPLYTVLGITEDDYVFLLRPELDEQNLLTILSPRGSVLGHRRITIEDSQLFYRELHLEAQGLITGLLGFDNYIKVVNWRGDKLLRELIDEQ